MSETDITGRRIFELQAEIERLRTECQSKSDQIAKLHSVCNEKAVLTNANERLRAALKPFADFADKAEQFVAARAEDGKSPIMPTSDFRLADFRRARAALEQRGDK